MKSMRIHDNEREYLDSWQHFQCMWLVQSRILRRPEDVWMTERGRVRKKAQSSTTTNLRWDIKNFPHEWKSKWIFLQIWISRDKISISWELSIFQSLLFLSFISQCKIPHIVCVFFSTFFLFFFFHRFKTQNPSHLMFIICNYSRQFLLRSMNLTLRNVITSNKSQCSINFGLRSVCRFH